MKHDPLHAGRVSTVIFTLVAAPLLAWRAVAAGRPARRQTA